MSWQLRQLPLITCSPLLTAASWAASNAAAAVSSAPHNIDPILAFGAFTGNGPRRILSRGRAVFIAARGFQNGVALYGSVRLQADVRLKPAATGLKMPYGSAIRGG